MRSVNQSIIRSAKKVLKNSGILVLDAHSTAFDIFITIIWMRMHFISARILVPYAGWLKYRRPNKYFISIFSKLLNIYILPVFRKEELKDGVEEKYTKGVYPAELTKAKKKEANHRFISEATYYLSSSNSIVLVAPFGSVEEFGKEIKTGVLRLLALNPFTIVSRSTRKTFWYTTKLSVFKCADVSNYLEYISNLFKTLI